MIILTMMVMVMIFLATGAASGVLNIEEYQYVLMFRRWASARSASTTETRVGSFRSWQASHKLKLLQTSRAQNHRCVMDNPKQKRGCLVMNFLGVGWGGAQGRSPSSWTSPCSHVPKSPGLASLFVFACFYSFLLSGPASAVTCLEVGRRVLSSSGWWAKQVRHLAMNMLV